MTMNKIIKEDYVSNKVARFLKEKGFDVPCRAYYNMGALKEDVTVPSDWSHSNFIDHVSAPTHQMAMKWLREIHKIDIDIISRLSLNADNDHNYSYVIKHQYDKYHYNTYTDGEYQYFEDAVEEAIKYCLINLIK